MTTRGEQRFRFWKLAAGPPVIVLVVAGIRLFGSPAPGSAPEVARLRPSPHREEASLVRPPAAPAPVRSGNPERTEPSPVPAVARHRIEDRYEVWDLPLEEFSWAARHPEEVFGSQLEPARGGGVRLLSPGGYAASRGFFAGDILLDVNGTAVFDAADLVREIRTSIDTGSRGWRILVDRGGHEITFDLRHSAGP